MPVTPGGTVRANLFHVLLNEEFHAGQYCVPCKLSNGRCPFTDCKNPTDYANAIENNGHLLALQGGRKGADVCVCSACDQDIEAPARVLADLRRRQEDSALDREFGRDV